jgi:ubiquitin carboxyl-terminal hydrolase L3
LWLPLTIGGFSIPENNPEVFTELIHRLGVSSKLGFFDVYSTEPELLAFVPRPAHALIFISPGDVYYRVYGREEANTNRQPSIEGKVVWYPQTIGNACGLIALLHAVSNGPARDYINPDSTLDRIIKESEPLSPEARAKVLYDSVELEKAHMASANRGDTAAPPAAEEPGYHFLAFVKGKDNHLYELEGGFNGAVDLGELQDDDCLSERALELGIGRYIKVADGNMEFSIISLSERAEEVNGV